MRDAFHIYKYRAMLRAGETLIEARMPHPLRAYPPWVATAPHRTFRVMTGMYARRNCNALPAVHAGAPPLPQADPRRRHPLQVRPGPVPDQLTAAASPPFGRHGGDAMVRPWPGPLPRSVSRRPCGVRPSRRPRPGRSSCCPSRPAASCPRAARCRWPARSADSPSRPRSNPAAEAAHIRMQVDRLVGGPTSDHRPHESAFEHGVGLRPVGPVGGHRVEAVGHGDHP